MKISFKLIAVLLVAICFVQCKSVDKLYEKGDYIGAFKKALNALEKSNKAEAKNKTWLNKSYVKLDQQLMDDYDDIKATIKLSEKERSYLRSEDIITTVLEGRRYLSESNKSQLDNLLNLQAKVRGDIAAELNKNADAIMESVPQTGDKRKAAEALQIYQRLSRVYGLHQADKIDRAVGYATFYYNFRVDHGFNLWYSSQMDGTFDDIESECEAGIVVTYRGNDKNIDCDVEVEFSNLDEQRDESASSTNYQENIEDGYTTRTDTSGKVIKTPIFRNVTATVYRNVERITYSFQIDCDVNRRSKWCEWSDERFNVSRYSEVIRYRLDGDRRAVPASVLNNLNTEGRHLRKDDMVQDLIREAFRLVRDEYF